MKKEKKTNWFIKAIIIIFIAEMMYMKSRYM